MHKVVGKLHESPDQCLAVKPDLNLTTVSTYTALKQQDFPVHQHDTWELIYYQAGYIRCVVDNKAFDTQPGMLLVIPPETDHYDVALTAYEQVYVHIRCSATPTWFEVYRDDHERALGALFTSLRREWRSSALNRTEMLALLLRQLDILLHRKKCEPEQTVPEQLVRAAERLLEEQLGLSPSIKEVADKLGVSTSALRAYFTKLRGHGPKAHLQKLQQRRALELIGNSDLSLEAIAELCGYYSASHLSRYVKRSTGRTPGAFRNSG